MDFVRAFIVENPILAASLSSLWGAVLIDLVSFSKAKAPGDFFGQFNMSVALWRYVQSFVGGFVGNAVIAGAAAGTVSLVLYLW